MENTTKKLVEETAKRMLEKVKSTLDRETTPEELNAVPEVAHAALALLNYTTTVD